MPDRRSGRIRPRRTSSTSISKKSLKAVARGESVIDPRVASAVVERLRSPGDQPDHNLSPHQFSVLQLMSQGFSNREIADRLFLSENTVKGYVQDVLRRLERQESRRSGHDRQPQGVAVDPASCPSIAIADEDSTARSSQLPVTRHVAIRLSHLNEAAGPLPKTRFRRGLRSRHAAPPAPGAARAESCPRRSLVIRRTRFAGSACRRESIATEAQDLRRELIRGRKAWFRNDVRLRHGTARGMRARYDGRLSHGWVLDQHALQFERADAVIGALEDVIGAADVPEVSVSITGCDVAGPVIGAFECRARARRVPQIALHETKRALSQSQRDLAVVRLFPVGIQECQFVARQRPSYCAWLEQLARAVADLGGRLRLPVAVTNGEAPGGATRSMTSGLSGSPALTTSRSLTG